MTEWRPWAPRGEELALRSYVLRDVVAEYAGIPGRSGESRLTRLRAVFDALAGLRIGYVYDDPTDRPDRQSIRTPEQVLWAPRHGTCLDLAVTFAAGCLAGGLHPILVLVDNPARGPGHALVLVRLDHDVISRVDGDTDADVWRDRPPDVARELTLPAAAARIVAVDPVAIAVSLGATSTRGLDTTLDAAIAAGANYLIGGNAWTWGFGVDLGGCWRKADEFPAAGRPAQEPLREPYRSPDTAPSPLRLLRAEYGITPFQSRDELTVLRHWAEEVAAGDRTGLAVVHGLGGSGKTRLALELAARLRRLGWYAGTLPRGEAGVEWLGTVASPLLVIVDYADGRVDGVIALLAAVRNRRRPAVVVLTARSTEGDWLPDIEVRAGRRPARLPDRGRRTA